MGLNKKQIHVFMNDDNTWSTRKSHTKKLLNKSSTQFEALGRAITQARREGNTEVVVHKNNKINFDTVHSAKKNKLNEITS